jgi:hypothetical protein
MVVAALSLVMCICVEGSCRHAQSHSEYNLAHASTGDFLGVVYVHLLSNSVV